MPDIEISLLMIVMGSTSNSSLIKQALITSFSEMSKYASITLFSLLSRTDEVSARSPNISPNAPRIIDFPAPVSPVIIFNCLSKCT